MLPTYLSLVVTTLFWGGTFIAGRALAGVVGPASAACIRFSIASLTLLILCRVIDGRITVPPIRLWPSLTLLGMTGVFGYNICFFSGLQHIEAGRAALIIALNPLAITILATVFLHEPLSLRQFGGIILSLTGALFVISNGHPERILTGGFGRGELLILGCVICWATYSLIGRTVLKTLSPLGAVFYSSVIGSLLLLPFAITEGDLGRIMQFSSITWLSLTFLGLLGTAVGFSLYYQAIRKIGATRAGVFINLVPLFAIILSWLLLNEAIKPAVLSGGLLVLAGVAITNMAKPKELSRNKKLFASTR